MVDSESGEVRNRMHNWIDMLIAFGFGFFIGGFFGFIVMGLMIASKRGEDEDG